MVSRQKRHHVDMTQGNVFQHLILFSLPLFAGNLFQQFYNTVDAWVVGNFVSDAAFSAVGTVTPIINTLISGFMGLSSGAGVVISQYYGAKKFDRLEQTVHTSISLTILLSILFTCLGIFITPTMLRFMKTPVEVFGESSTYLSIYFSGMAGLMFYNMGSGILRAVGESRLPFYYLVVTVVLNTVLDLLFVIVLGMGVEGVAYATVIAQGVSAALTMLTLLRTESCVRFTPRKLRFHGRILKQIIQVGIPAALQLAITSFSNVFVQSYINQFGKDCMGGWTAYSKLDQILTLPIQSLSLAATTFVGQNLGTGQGKRARQGVRTALTMALCTTAVLASLVAFAAPTLVSFFSDTPEVISYGVLFLRNLSPFFLICAVNQIYAGALRGAGNSRAPMFIMLGSFVLFRQCYLYVVSNFISNTILPLAFGYPAGWILCTTIMTIYYHRFQMDKTQLVLEDNSET